MRLALDHHCSARIAELLRLSGHEVVAVMERGCFVIIARSWTAEARSHTGLIFTSDASMSRSRDSVGRYAEVLDEVMHAGPHALRDRVLWL